LAARTPMPRRKATTRYKLNNTPFKLSKTNICTQS
jgi:hypothetical protein